MNNCIEISGECFSFEIRQRRADKKIFIYTLFSLFSFSFCLSSLLFPLNLLPSSYYLETVSKFEMGAIFN